jgi:hypothetical protein
MTTTDCNTPQQATPTEPAHIVTVNTAGELRCTCQRFEVNALLFGAGECDHTRAAEQARAANVLSEITRQLKTESCFTWPAGRLHRWPQWLTYDMVCGLVNDGTLRRVHYGPAMMGHQEYFLVEWSK